METIIEAQKTMLKILSLGNETLMLSGSDLYELSERSKSMKVYELDVPKVELDRIEYFKSYINSKKIKRYSGRRYRVELFPNEILILIFYHVIELKEGNIMLLYNCSRSDLYLLRSSTEFLYECNSIFGEDDINSIIKHINVDIELREFKMWKAMTLQRIEFLKSEYPNIESAYESFINSSTNLTFDEGEEWFDSYIKHNTIGGTQGD